MALFEENHSGFYNSVEHDRVYTAEDIGKMFDGILTDGIFQWFGTAFRPVVTEGTNIITIGNGRAWFIKHWIHYETGIAVEIEASDLNNTRYDAVVLYVNNNDDVREGGIKVVKGTPSSDPKYPTLANKPGVYKEYPICYVRVDSNYGAIPVLDASDIIDTRGTPACPYATGINQSSNVDVRVLGQITSFANIPITYTNFAKINYSGSDTNAPITSTGTWWWNVLTICAGNSRRVTQMAFSVFRRSGYNGCVFIRQRHDSIWTSWFKIDAEDISTLKTNLTTLSGKVTQNTNSIKTINTSLTADETALSKIGTRWSFQQTISGADDWFSTGLSIPAVSGSTPGTRSVVHTVTKAEVGMYIMATSLYLNFSPTSGRFGFHITWTGTGGGVTDILTAYSGHGNWAGGGSVSATRVVSLTEGGKVTITLQNYTDKAATFNRDADASFCQFVRIK